MSTYEFVCVAIRSFILGAFLLILGACGMRFGQQDEIFTTYIRHFETKMNKTAWFLDVMLVDEIRVKENNNDIVVVGVCLSGLRVKILKEFWENTSEHNRRTVIMHELGHCVMNWGHTNELLPDGCPVSFMNPVLTNITSECYDKVYGKDEFSDSNFNEKNFVEIENENWVME